MKKRRKTTTEQSDSTSRVTPYELATLAARICSEHCIADPKGAIAAAQRLLAQGKFALRLAEEQERIEKEVEEERERIVKEERVDWSRGIKLITRETRRDRAMKRFKQFLEYEYPGEAEEQLSIYKRDGFTLHEELSLEAVFSNWRKQPKRKKGKQGRRISEHDGRLRMGSMRLLPIRPRKAT